MHVEIRGDGPPLVLVPGGGGDAGMYAALAGELAPRFTVITYDRRGNSRSGPAGDVSIAAQAEDVVTILDEHEIGEAYVFGNSGGALIALELLVEHEERLLGAVVHEPPLLTVLPDAAEQRAFFDGVMAEKNHLVAFWRFGASTMDRPTKVPARLGALMLRFAPQGMRRLVGNAEHLIRREMPAFLDYEPDLEALSRVTVPWCFAVGEASEGRFYSRPARLLAPRLGVQCREFPGGHTAYQQVPVEFAARLEDCLGTGSRRDSTRGADADRQR
ncbi:alpha/beta hydrolase [Lentzea tibetensis]|uniref:Alpha/beta hydrolase n=1 Tax=Lentzea tibetensis TaxID=2591470 RepID=A0A563F0D5_9PSEU|nr:alpha/beta hydrolase [Lentzea tibetensis]TWP53379.1 alpha/beta hydrolase [Lentzea tibetensis]